MSVLELTKNLEKIVDKFNLTEMVELYKNEFAISNSKELEKALNSLKEEGRTLKIGIVGRVKAGKSSLLNSLIFDGKDILPKAATPMTAALTILEYSENIGAKVDFFSKDDIEDIKKDYEKYQKQFEEKYQNKYQEMVQRLEKKGKEIVPNDIKEKVTKQVKRELSELATLSSAYEQYSKIKNSGISVDELEQFKTISAKDSNELNNKLKEFVGANGKYMPFTKSVILQLNEKSLQGIQIIDTPGVNDPVVSREERTKELLKYCDAVLIVSPSGQFLSSEDINLFDRITSKEGIQEVYIVASQIDNQLWGSEKVEGNGILPNILNNISSKLTTYTKNIFQKDEELKETKLYKNILKNEVICSSALSYALYKKFDTPELWDSNETHTFNRLETEYKDFFDTKEIAKQSLLNLSSIDKIRIILENLKIKKNEILEEKQKNFENNKLKIIKDYQNSLILDIENKMSQIKNSDIDKIKKQKNSLEKIEKEMSIYINEVYQDLVEDLDRSLKSLLNENLNSYFRKTKQDINQSEGSETETWNEEYTVDKGSGFLFWRDLTGNRYETKTRTKSETYTTARAGFVRNSLEELTDSIEMTIDMSVKKYLKEWRKSVFKEIITNLREKVDDEKLDVSIISRTIRKVVNSVELPDISYTGTFPDNLKRSGTLTGGDAETFLSEATNYVSDMKNRVKTDIKVYLNSLVSNLNQIDIGSNIFENYRKEIKDLEYKIANKELMLERYNNILKELNENKKV